MHDAAHLPIWILSSEPSFLTHDTSERVTTMSRRLNELFCGRNSPTLASMSVSSPLKLKSCLTYTPLMTSSGPPQRYISQGGVACSQCIELEGMACSQ
jgi:hypothetical protein